MSINLKKEECIGCYICYDICPTKAIELCTDQHGFNYPIVDNDKCINCGKCDLMCTINKENIKEKSHSYWAAKNLDDDIRQESSSGGVFAALAQYVLDKNGVVYGCKMDEHQRAVFDRAEDWSSCRAFMGSKYVQSDMRGTIEQLKEDLKKGKQVLFTGAPCQCMAVKYNVDMTVYRDRIIFCEYLCHGAPSPMVFEDFKKHMEEKYKGKITKFVFRDKDKIRVKPSSRGIRMQISTNKEILDVYDARENNKYFEIFKFCYDLRESCYKCPCIGDERYADITLGDYWGCEKYYERFFDKNGISLIIINTEHGEKIFEAIRKAFNVIPIKKDEIVQPMLVAPPRKRGNYTLFWEIYQNEGFEQAAELVLKTNKPPIIIRLKTKLAEILPPKVVSIIRKRKK